MTHTSCNAFVFVLFQSCVVAIVVPDVETVKIWASANEIPGTLSVLCADDRVKALLLEDITRLGKQGWRFLHIFL